jgi:hypothetical protein
MTKYIDLTKPKEITMKIGNDVIVIPELSYAEYNQVYDYEHNEKTTRKDEAKMTLWLLNRNTSGKVFTEEDLGKLPMSAVSLIYRACILMTQKVLNDPN